MIEIKESGNDFIFTYLHKPTDKNNSTFGFEVYNIAAYNNPPFLGNFPKTDGNLMSLEL